MPFIVGAGASLLGAGYKAFTAGKQRRAAAALREVDVTPEGVRQNRIMAQQEYAAARMPGVDEAERRIEQSTDSTLGAARQGATSGTSILGALSRANGQRLAALGNLSTQQQQYHQAATGKLAAANTTQAQWDDKSRTELQNAKASLTQAAISNDASALNDVGNTGAMIAGHAADKEFMSANPGAQLTSPSMLRRSYRRGYPINGNSSANMGGYA